MDKEKLLENLSRPKPWDNAPVFCFTTDIDWASETVLKIFFDELGSMRVWPHTFVTHQSEIIKDLSRSNKIETGIHPNFLSGSSHGNSFIEVIENCLKLVPNSWIYRSHRAFNVTDTSHLLFHKYGQKVSSNLVTLMNENIRPVLHESGLIEFPVFFEDGTHLFNKMDLSIEKYRKRFVTPGIKIINIHPMNYVINPSSIGYMRNIKDTLSRESYNSLAEADIRKYRNNERGIRDLNKEVIALSKDFKVVKLSELYEIAVN